ncbi:unnamed protein product [Acanthoscelides obtectus]|uniref:Uncharacterized protein n=1 Tax=Acanthoscelides obtectus TaxID=200917 RepID=A0A9P0KGZ7_ACAOB|nr:unnamed protein product [Acanthoscelides obtectus]CAK1660506.1 hypothetical protein AOBTE_LOCUS22122 [Acanthoscelides obtectus]
MVANFVFLVAFCLAAGSAISLSPVVEEPESLIQRLEDEFLDIQNEWDGHSEEVFDNLLDEVALEGCHPDKEKIKKCIQKYLPEIRALRKKIIDQVGKR